MIELYAGSRKITGAEYDEPKQAFREAGWVSRELGERIFLVQDGRVIGAVLSSPNNRIQYGHFARRGS